MQVKTSLYINQKKNVQKFKIKFLFINNFILIKVTSYREINENLP